MLLPNDWPGLRAVGLFCLARDGFSSGGWTPWGPNHQHREQISSLICGELPPYQGRGDLSGELGIDCKPFIEVRSPAEPIGYGNQTSVDERFRSDDRSVTAACE
jgi:hypothetical protein